MSIYYNLGELLSYNCLFNFVIGNRGGGKTYGFKDWAIKDFLKNGNQFIYLRRYKSELVDSDKFFSDIQLAYPDHEFKVDGRTFKIDDEVAGYAVALSTALTKKSVPYPLVNKIGFDEFLVDKGAIHYLPNEVTAFLEFYSTVSRLREGSLKNEVRVLFMGNNISITNPYFNYFSIRPNLNKRFNKFKNDIMIEYYKSEEFINKMKATRFGKMIDGTEYADYAIENKSLFDNDEFVEKRTPNCKYACTVIYKNTKVGFWTDYKEGLIFASEVIDQSCKWQYCLLNKDAHPNIMLCKNAKKDFRLSQIIKAFEYGYLRYENMRIKSTALEIVRMII